MTEKNRLKIAVQKSGRLADGSLELLKKCGISFEKSKDQLFCKAINFPADILFVRDDDIPAFVAAGVCQIGIIGQNVLEEKKLALNGAAQNITAVIPLGFGRCRLSIAAPAGMPFKNLKSLEGKTIATSYKGVLESYLSAQGVSARIISMSGAVEIAPRMKISDAICDLVSTGATLSANGLSELQTVLESQAFLIKNTGISKAQSDLLARLSLRIRSVQTALESKYIMLHCPVSALEDIKNSLPGVETPTVLPLQNCNDKVAVHAVCNEGIFWDTMEELKAKGASAILVLPIEKMLD